MWYYNDTVAGHQQSSWELYNGSKESGGGGGGSGDDDDDDGDGDGDDDVFKCQLWWQWYTSIPSSDVQIHWLFYQHTGFLTCRNLYRLTNITLWSSHCII